MRKKFITLSLLTLGVLVIAYMFRGVVGQERMTRGFPIPNIGAYVGEVNLPETLGGRSTLYLERLREGDTLLTILFVEQFQPQTLFPERLIRAEGEELYRPLILRMNDTILRFSGVKDEQTLKGVIRSEKGSVGEWTLRKLELGELRKLDAKSDQLASWVRSRERARMAKERLDAALGRKAEIASKIDILERSLADEASLRTRAESRKQELVLALTQKKEARANLTKAVDSLASELELLSRITKRGQAISLERRILQRENRWYDVNWQSEEEIGQEELPAEEAGIDIAKFEQAVRQARETKALLREREEELRKIRAAETSESVPEEASPEESPEEPSETEPTEPQKEENMWNRLFG